MGGEAPSADTKAAETYFQILRKSIQGGYTAQQIHNFDDSGLFWKECLIETTFPRKKIQCPRIQHSERQANVFAWR